LAFCSLRSLILANFILPVNRALYLHGGLVKFSTNTFGRRLEFLTQAIVGKFDSAEKLTTKVSQLLQTEMDIFEKRSEGIPDSLLEFDDNIHCIDEINEYWDVFEAFPMIQRRSDLISICSIFENGLKQIQAIAEEFSTAENDGSKITNQGIIEKFKSHIESDKNISFSDNPCWEEVLLIQQLRNRFVHHDGFVKSGNVELMNYIESNSSINLNSESKVIVSNSFIPYCINIFVNFFIHLFNQLKGK
jgi:hypothetical protein